MAPLQEILPTTEPFLLTNWYLISSPVVGQDKDAFVTASGFATGVAVM